jgi:GT2 family glycosyltransferase
MDANVPVFTVVIPYTHSFDDIERCLASLERIDYPKDRFQIVLVDCRVLSDPDDLITQKISDYSLQIQTLRLPEKAGKVKSWMVEARINEARNFAIKKIPSQFYVFTSDDCTFGTDWLRNFEEAMDENTGILGGPDILPEGLGWYPEAVDYILNSYLGNAGMRRGDRLRQGEYYPRKENMAVPKWVFERIGYFNEDLMFGAEMDFTTRIRDAGYQVMFLADNPVWHRRVTSLPNHIQVKAHMTSEKVLIARQKGRFAHSLYFIVLVAILFGTVITISALINPLARMAFVVLLLLYLTALLTVVLSATIRSHSLRVGLGVLWLMPLHHLIIAYGSVKGFFSKLSGK